MPKQRYQQDLTRAEFCSDPAQALVVDRLENLHAELAVPQSEDSMVSRITGIFNRKKLSYSAPQGLYIWGSVGRGKTYLMDLFYDCLSTRHKKRMHFHRFMLEVHRQLKKAANNENPLEIVATKFRKNAHVICLDEFYVSDIGDAMILAGLLEALFTQGMTLITTSNCAPDDLYKNGLQRQRFLPAIELIKQHTLVTELGGHTDHRLNYLESADIYHYPLDDSTESIMQEAFMRVSPGLDRKGGSLKINDRKIPMRQSSDGVAWFEFNALCDGPRGASDYIEIARCYNTVLISNIPVLTNKDDVTRRFISAIDEFYDRCVNLIISAAAPAQNLYTGNKLSFEFKRTISRLNEMQSHEYLAKPHRSL